MHAVTGHERLEWREVPTPSPGPGEVRIAVRATAVNRADLLQRRGLYPPPPGAPDLLGLECAGVVEAVGAGVAVPLGTRVCALLAGGGYAERVVVPAGQVLSLPDGLSFVEAAALPEALCTVWMVLDLAHARPGERVLLHAGASGIGTTAIAVCHELGLRTFVTASAAKIARCVALGAEGGAERGAGWAPAVRAWAPDGVDLIVDPVGGPYLPLDQQVLAVGGRIVVLGLMGGARAELDLGRLLVFRQQVLGTVLRARDASDKARIVAGVARDLWPAVEAGRLRAVIDLVLPIERVEEAHARVASDATVGKVVLEIASAPAPPPHGSAMIGGGNHRPSRIVSPGR